MSINIAEDSVKTTSEPVAISQESVDAKIEITDEATAIVTSQNYVVTSERMAGFSNGSMPDWLVSSIDIALSNGYADQEQVIHDLSVLIAGIEKGVHQSISSIETQVISQNTKIDTVKSELNGNAAAILDVKTTLVTDYSSSAETANILDSAFGENNAIILSTARTIATDEISASYTQNDLLNRVTNTENNSTATSGNVSQGYSVVGLNPDGSLSATAGTSEYATAVVGPLDIRLASIEGVSAGIPHEITVAESSVVGWVPKIGQYKESSTSTGVPEDGSRHYWEYVGGAFGKDSNGWNYIGTTRPTSETSWTGGASKILYDTNNNPTGWGFYNGANYQGSTGSVFAIYADNFYVQNSIGNHKPFSIDSAGIHFDGKVSFGGVTDALIGTEYDNATLAADLASSAGTTTIDGGNIKTGRIQQVGYTPGDNTKNSHWNLETGEFITHNSTGTFVLDSTATGTSPNIHGAVIDGATITGGSIDASVDITAPILKTANVRVACKNYPDNYGPIGYASSGQGSTTAYSGTIQGNAPIGYQVNRICSNTESIVYTVVTFDTGGNSSDTAYLQRSIDGASYLTIFELGFALIGRTLSYVDTTLPDTFNSVVYRVYSPTGSSQSILVNVSNGA